MFSFISRRGWIVNVMPRLLSLCRTRPERAPQPVWTWSRDKSPSLPGSEPRLPRRTSCSPFAILIKLRGSPPSMSRSRKDVSASIPSLSPHFSPCILFPYIINSSCHFVHKNVGPDDHVITFTSGKHFGLFDIGLRFMEGKTTRQKIESLKLCSVASL
jgi:hypothetical protein